MNLEPLTICKVRLCRIDGIGYNVNLSFSTNETYASTNKLSIIRKERHPGESFSRIFVWKEIILAFKNGGEGEIRYLKNPRRIKKLYFKATDNINHFNSAQRQAIKKLIKRYNLFMNRKYSCDGCIYKNQYLLTNKCEKIYTTKDETY